MLPIFMLCCYALWLGPASWWWRVPWGFVALVLGIELLLCAAQRVRERF